MFHCRLIRTVINLSLIVVMMIQPGMALVFANDCSAKRASSFTCEGCSCCEVASLKEKCGCCGGGEPAAVQKSCCADDTESEHAWGRSDDMMHSDETLVRRVTLLSARGAVVAADFDPAMSEATAGVAVTSTCGCGIESPPLDEFAPTRSSIPTREFVAIRHSDLADLFGGPVLPQRPVSVRDEDFLRPPNFSQIQLGVWRL